MTWNNKKLDELKSVDSEEARELYKKYHKEKEENSNEPPSNEEDIKTVYSDYRENKDNKLEKPVNSEKDISSFCETYSDYKENPEKLQAYGIFIGDYKLPITPENINFRNDTEPKIFKSITGKDIIVGVNVLPREVSFVSYFPDTVKGVKPDRSPKEYKDYFQDLKNKGKKILFQIEGTGDSFFAYITKFDYDYIPGKDIDYTMTLKEYSEVSENDFEI